MRLVQYPDPATPQELREAAEVAEANAEEARGQVAFFDRLAQDLRTEAEAKERGER